MNNLTAQGRALVQALGVVMPETMLAPLTEATHRAEHASRSDPDATHCNVQAISDAYYAVIGA